MRLDERRASRAACLSCGLCAQLTWASRYWAVPSAAELALRKILAGCRNRLSTPPKSSAGPTRRFSWCTSNGWPTPAGHKGRRTGRQPTTRGARRASRSLHLAALAAPHPPCPSPPPSPTPRAFLAPAGCSQGPKRPPGRACGLPAGPGLSAAGASAALQRAACLLGACCSGLIPVRTLFSPAAFGGVWGCWGCRAWHWAGAETFLVVKI